MTTYEINEKYNKLQKHKLDQELIDEVFNTDLRNKFQDPDKVRKICELRLQKKSYLVIGNLVNLSDSMVRYHCNRVLYTYKRELNRMRHEELKSAKIANVQIFKREANLHDIDEELLAKEISKLPIWGIEDQEERNKILLEWFYKEADEQEE